MENFKLISTLKDYTTSKGWYFLSGDNFHQNFEATQYEYEPGALVLAVDFDASPSFSIGNSISSIDYTGVIALGRKIEEDELTYSNLDETFWQKYINRLEELMQLLTIAIIDIACNNELEIRNVKYRMDLNKFDTNIDFVAAEITLVQ